MSNQDTSSYTLHLADTTLILGQRLSEWCGHGPALEEDIALTNTALDYLGQATNLYKYAAQLEGKGQDEDQLAFLRDAWDYKNHLITELPNGDYAYTIARQFFFSAWYGYTLQQLMQCPDEYMRAFAEKSIKEVRYHLQHSADWMKRLGDGTEESHARLQKAVNEIWTYTGELFMPASYESALNWINQDELKNNWDALVTATLKESNITLPADQWMQRGGKEGKHSEHLGFILAEMQFLPRAYPNAKW